MNCLRSLPQSGLRGTKGIGLENMTLLTLTLLYRCLCPEGLNTLFL